MNNRITLRIYDYLTNNYIDNEQFINNNNLGEDRYCILR